jgi:hypothetical protein
MIAALLLSVPLLWLLYVVGIQYQRGGWWRLCVVVAVPALGLNVALNYTLLALITWDWPQRGEYTFSQRLERLVNAPGWRGLLAWAVAKYLLDQFDPDGIHIKPRTRSTDG